MHAQGVRRALALWFVVGLGIGCAFKDKVIAGSDGSSGVRDLAGADRGAASTDDLNRETTPARLIPVVPPADWNPDADLTPQYIRITYRHDPWNSAVIQWETPRKDPSAYVPKVWLVRASDVPGADPSQYETAVTLPVDLDLLFVGEGVRYCQTFACDETNLTGLLWTVDVTGLEPDTHYYYRVGTWSSFDEETGTFTGANLSPAYHFRTGLPKGSRQSFRLLYGADSQNWVKDVSEKVTVIRNTTGKGMRFWLMGGDLTEVGIQEEIWGWCEVMAPLLRYVPLMAVRGNHDFLPLPFYGSFTFPEMDLLDADLKEAAWSFRFGNLHVAGIDSTNEYRVERQVPWLDQDLAAAAQDPDIDWKIVIFHHPAYSSCNVHGSTDYIQRLVVPILDRYGVDLALSGHDHDYERTKPLKGGQIQDAGHGTVYITAGGFFSKKSYGNGVSDFTAVSFDGEIKNYVVLDVEGKTLRGTTYNGAHEVIDTFVLTRP